MDLMTLTIYLAGALTIIGMWAVRVPHENVRIVFVLGIIWPFTIVAMLFMMIVVATGWNFDVDTNAGKMFNFRRPTNPAAKGFGLCLLGVEFQLYKPAK